MVHDSGIKGGAIAPLEMRKRAKVIQAGANATVPQITLHIGASFGAGGYEIYGRAFEVRFAFAWPNNRLAEMGGEQVERVMTIIAEDRALREGVELDREDYSASNVFLSISSAGSPQLCLLRHGLGMVELSPQGIPRDTGSPAAKPGVAALIPTNLE